MACVVFRSALGAGVLVTGMVAQAGPYSRPSNDPGNAYDAPIPRGDARIVGFETGVADYSPAPAVSAEFTHPLTGLASLGDLSLAQIFNGVRPGSITLSFTQPLTDGAGADFCVFENGFSFGGPNGLYAELAYVEVSSNGTDFVRFPSISLNTGPLPGGFGPAFSAFDATNMYNLAGKHLADWGTPFDLNEISTHALVTAGVVDLDNIAFVRLVDIPGSQTFLDSQGHGIIDNWVTQGSGGFDYVGLPTGAVGAIHQVPAGWSVGVMGGVGVTAARRRRR